MNRKQYLSRRLHLVDIENMIGSPRPNPSEVAGFRDLYGELGLAKTGDLVVIACNHGAELAAHAGWSSVRVVARSGPNGADLALLKVLAEENVPERFGEVVLCSGDGIFSEALGRLAAQGVKTTVVSRGDSLSVQLRLAAGSVIAVSPRPAPEACEAALEESA